MEIAECNRPVTANISRIIEEKGLKQASVAEKAGLTPQKFSDMLNGRRIMKAIEIEAIIDVLNVDANTLFGMRGESLKE